MKGHARAVHDVESPQRRILDRKAADVHVANVPEDKEPKAPDFGHGLFGVVPGVSIAVDAADGAVAIDRDVRTCDDEAGGVVSKDDGVDVCAPVGEVVGELGAGASMLGLFGSLTR